MRRRGLRIFVIGALLGGAAGCDVPMPATTRYFEASFPPGGEPTDWRRVDPELRAAGIRLHVDVEDTVSRDSLGEVDRCLDVMATALDRLPAGVERSHVAAAAKHIHERAQLLANGVHDDAEQRAVIKDALDSAVWAMLALSGYKYSLDPGVGERVARFRDKVDAIDTPSVGLGRLDIYEALLGGRDALDGFLLAIAHGKVHVP
jgi:hypothetical protein